MTAGLSAVAPVLSNFLYGYEYGQPENKQAKEKEKIMRVYDDNGQVSLDIIHEVESSLGYNFPMSYINLIKDHDALAPVENVFYF